MIIAIRFARSRYAVLLCHLQEEMISQEAQFCICNFEIILLEWLLGYSAFPLSSKREKDPVMVWGVGQRGEKIFWKQTKGRKKEEDSGGGYLQSGASLMFMFRVEPFSLNDSGLDRERSVCNDLGLQTVFPFIGKRKTTNVNTLGRLSEDWVEVSIVVVKLCVFFCGGVMSS